MDIMLVVKDPGGTNNALPVVPALKRKGKKVLAVANGFAAGERGLQATSEQVFLSAKSAEAVVEMFGVPKVLITSMCSEGGVGRDLVPLTRKAGGIAVAMSDFPGARFLEKATWADPKYRPDYVVVGSDGAKRITENMWPDVPRENILALGRPGLDVYANFDVAGASADVRKAFNMTEEKPVILAGGAGPHSAHMLTELVAALNELGRDCYLILRPHPRMAVNYAAEVGPWESAKEGFKSGTLIADSSVFKDVKPLIAAADCVIAMYSTILEEAGVLRKTNISVFYPDKAKVLWDQEMKGKIKRFPFVDLGCTAEATNRTELAAQLSLFFDGRLDLRQAQEENLCADGRNAERVANFIVSLL